MSEHIDEQISEFIDDEMTVDECAFFVRRLERDRGARSRYIRYQLIGAAVRGEHRAFNSACAGQQSGVVVRRTPQGSEVTDQPAGNGFAVAVGIAASLALVAVFAFSLASYTGGAVFGSGEGTYAAGRTSYPVQRPAQPVQVRSEAMGMQYLMQHTGYTTGVSRTIMHSSVISGPQFEAIEDPREFSLE
jgi:hypothetical protein